MKKTLLAVSVLSTLFMAGTANAWVTSEDGTFAGQLDFNGTITDTNPDWMWEVPEDTVTAATGWDALRINAIANGDNSEFHFIAKPALDLIRGYMKEPAATGGAGLTPVIKVGAGDAVVTLDGTVQALTLVAAGLDASDAATADGQMKMNVQGYLGGAIENTYFGAVEVQSIISANQVAFDTNYPEITAGTSSWADAEALFPLDTTLKLSGAYLAKISDYKVSFPTASIPAKWSTVVPVTVTFK